MANLAIKGHAIRGKEVIEILEMLGGENLYRKCGSKNDLFYYLSNEQRICSLPISESYKGEFILFTLEEFLEKFPYKVGDKVKVKETGKDVTIEGMSWRNGCEVIYDTCYNNDCVAFYSAEDLQPYEELNFGECIEKTIDECLFGRDEDTMVKENYSPITLLPLSNKVMIVPTNEDSEIIEENGKFYLVKKQQQYPKTYEECCEILSIPTYYKLRYYTYEHGYNEYTTLNKLCSLQDKLNILGKLLICRDAYWKIAGEQMGLDEPWEPDYSQNSNTKYTITFAENEFYTDVSYIFHYFLIFPTEEMRDAFYENFKALINEIKKL